MDTLYKKGDIIYFDTTSFKRQSVSIVNVVIDQVYTDRKIVVKDKEYRIDLTNRYLGNIVNNDYTFWSHTQEWKDLVNEHLYHSDMDVYIRLKVLIIFDNNREQVDYYEVGPKSIHFDYVEDFDNDLKNYIDSKRISEHENISNIIFGSEEKQELRVKNLGET